MPSDVRFAVIRRLLLGKGYTLDRTRGSHHTFTKAGQPLITIPVHRGKAKHVYLKEAQKAP